MGRTRQGRDFNRGGLKFTGEWQAWPLADISTAVPEDQRWGKGKSQLDAILAESYLDTRLATEAEVKAHVKLQAAALDANISKAEMAQYITKLEGRLRDQADRIAALEVKLNGDKPPKKVDELPPPNPANVPQQRG